MGCASDSPPRSHLRNQGRVVSSPKWREVSVLGSSPPVPGDRRDRFPLTFSQIREGTYRMPFAKLSHILASLDSRTKACFL